MVENETLLDGPASEPAPLAPEAQAEGEAAGVAEIDPAAPEFHLRPSRAPEPRSDCSDPIAVTPEVPSVGLRLRVPETHSEFPADSLPATTSLSPLSDLRPLGQIHNSFIIAAGRDGLWIIDQHVAHERILFEKLLKQRAAGDVEVQRLLMPRILELPAKRQIEFASIA